uniref:Uncharacterized protein n=1 Tax=Pongo abelii TaxID=9601 RepID=H2PT69_PONAB
LFLPDLEAGKWKSIVPAPGEGLLAVLHMMVERSVKWQTGVCYNGGKDFAISLVRPKAAEGIGNILHLVIVF